MNRKGRRTVLVVALVLLAGVGYLLFRPRPLGVETVAARRGPMLTTIDDEGEIRVRDRYLVTAPVSGELVRITLKQGDSVLPGDIVATLVAAPMDARARAAARARLEQAEDADRATRAQVAGARAALEQARRGRQRSETLSAQKALAPAEREAAELEETTRLRDLESADFQQQASAHEVEAARAALAAGSGTRMALRSPVGGRVLRVAEASARVVAPGETLLELGDCSDLEVVTDLLTSDAVNVPVGAAILIDGWGGTDTLRGLVRRVEPSAFTKVSALGVEEQRVNVLGNLLQIPSGLGDRFRVQVHIVTWQSPSVLRIPASALFRRGSAWAVFVVVDGRAYRRDVVVGHRNGSDAEILKGLDEGEVVIPNPSDQVTDGKEVRAARPGT